MKKITGSILALMLVSSFTLIDAQQTPADTIKTQDIREVVVTGALGLKKRQDAVTSANQVVSSAEITQGKNPNAVQALTGKVSGLQINTTNNSVNPSTRVVLRGPRTISGSNEALVVIDGAISSLSILQNLPPDIIESMNVIKGMQGAALYGERGGNGVIIVTTKRGSKAEKLQFTLNNSIDFASVYKTPIYQDKYGQGWPGDVFDLTDYGGTNWVPYENSNWGPAYTSALGGQNVFIGLPQANNQFLTENYSFKDKHINKFFKTGVLIQNGLSVNAGGSDGYVFFSVNRAENDFIVEKDNLKRNNFIFKAGKQLGKFRVDGNINYLETKTSTTASDLYTELLQSPTNLDVRKFRYSLPDAGYSPYITNPYWKIDNERFDNKNRIVNALLNLEYKFNNNISLTYAGSVSLGHTTAESHLNAFANDRVYEGTGTYIDGHTPADFGQVPIVSNYFKTVGNSWKYYGDLMLNFDYDLSDNFNLKANLGYNSQDATSSKASVGGENLQVPGWYHINNVLNLEKNYNLDNRNERERSYAGFLNVDLSYKDFLFLNTTFRYEKNSRISITPTGTYELQNQGFPYYSVGASFVPTRAFASIKGDVLNYAKISASYTRVGNVQTIPVYALDETGVFPTGYPFGDLASYLPRTASYSQDITPEFIDSKEATLSLGFFKDRITFEGSVYRNDTDNLITNIAASSTTGITSLVDNIGKSVNKGFELDLGITPVKTKNFEWKLRGSYSTYDTKITELADGAEEIPLLTTTSPNVGIYAMTGYDFPMIKGTKYLRDPNGNIVVGANGNPLTTSSLEILGKVNPDYILAFGTSIRFKGLTLSGTADYRTGNSFISRTKVLMGNMGSLEKQADFDRSQGYIVPNSVQLVNGQYVPNQTPVGGAATYTSMNSYFASATYLGVGEEFLVDGTALKVREISLSYDLPKSVLQSTFVNSLTFGVYARNPFVIYAKDNRNYADPETATTTGNAGGIADNTQYPTQRNFGFNINVTF